jgi:hypothetical protein
VRAFAAQAAAEAFGLTVTVIGEQPDADGELATTYGTPTPGVPHVHILEIAHPGRAFHAAHPRTQRLGDDILRVLTTELPPDLRVDTELATTGQPGRDVTFGTGWSQQSRGYRVADVQSGRWLRREPLTPGEQALAAAVEALPAGGRDLVVVGAPGPLPAHGIARRLRKLVHQSADPANMLLLFLGRLRSEQRRWAPRRVDKSGLRIVYTDGEVRPGHAGMVYSTRPWQEVARAPGKPRQLGLVYPSPAWDQALAGWQVLAGVRRILCGLWLLPSNVDYDAELADALRALPPDPDRLTIVASGFADATALRQRLDAVFDRMPPAALAGLRLAAPDVAGSADLAVEVMRQRQIPVVAPAPDWSPAPAADGRLRLPGPSGPVWTEVGWQSHQPPAYRRLAAALNLESVSEADLTRLVGDFLGGARPVAAADRRTLVRLAARLGGDGGPDLAVDRLREVFLELEQAASTVDPLFDPVVGVAGLAVPSAGLRAAVASASLAGSLLGGAAHLFVLGDQPPAHEDPGGGDPQAVFLASRIIRSGRWTSGQPVVLLADNAGRSVEGRPPLASRVARLLKSATVFGAGGRAAPDPGDGSLAVWPARDLRSDPDWSAFAPDTDPWPPSPPASPTTGAASAAVPRPRISDDSQPADWRDDPAKVDNARLVAPVYRRLAAALDVEQVSEADLSRLVDGYLAGACPVAAADRRTLVRLAAQLGWDRGPDLTEAWLAETFHELERLAGTVALPLGNVLGVAGRVVPSMGLRGAVALAGLAGGHPRGLLVVGDQPPSEDGGVDSDDPQVQFLVNRILDSDRWTPGQPVVLLADNAGRSVDGLPPLAWRLAQRLNSAPTPFTTTTVFGAGGRPVPDPGDGSLAVWPTRDPRSDAEWSWFARDGGPTAHRLDHFLDLVWRHRSLIQGGTIGAYELYSHVTGAHPLTVSSDDHLRRVAAAQGNRPGAAEALVQIRPDENLDDLIQAGRLYTEAAGAFVWFRRAGARDIPIRRRLYLNPRPNAAAALMHALVRHVVDDPGNYPGVHSAKIAGPAGIASRSDRIVVYTDSAETVDLVVDWLRAYAAAYPGTFEDITPPLTREIMTGVAAGDHPRSRGSSFGLLRSSAVDEALRETVTGGGGRAAFADAARRRLRAARVDPDFPHANLRLEPRRQLTATAPADTVRPHPLPVRLHTTLGGERGATPAIPAAVESTVERPGQAETTEQQIAAGNLPGRELEQARSAAGPLAVPAGRYLAAAADTTEHVRAARSLPRVEGVDVLVGHGDPSGSGLRVDDRPASDEQVARLLASGGRTGLLAGCDTDAQARRLAALLNRDMLGVEGLLWFTDDGRALVRRPAYSAGGRPLISTQPGNVVLHRAPDAVGDARSAPLGDDLIAALNALPSGRSSAPVTLDPASRPRQPVAFTNPPPPARTPRPASARARTRLPGELRPPHGAGRPVVPGQPLTDADRLNARLAMPPGEHDDLVQEMREDGVSAALLADHPTEMAALRYYLTAARAFDARAAAGDTEALSIVHCAYAALAWLPTVDAPSYRPLRAAAGQDAESFVRELLATRHLLIGYRRPGWGHGDAVIEFPGTGWDISMLIGGPGAVLVDATRQHELLVLPDGMAPGVPLISLQAA